MVLGEGEVPTAFTPFIEALTAIPPGTRPPLHVHLALIHAKCRCYSPCTPSHEDAEESLAKRVAASAGLVARAISAAASMAGSDAKVFAFSI